MIQPNAMQEAFTWRAANSGDIPRLIELGIVAYSAYAPFMPAESFAKMKSNIGNEETWKGLLAKAHSFVCLHNDKIVGMAFLVPSGNPWDIFPAEWAYIRMVGVDPDYKGQGIAKILMKQCVARARELNETVVALHTSERMHAARHIYEAMGFTILKEIEPRLGMRYWVYTLELQGENRARSVPVVIVDYSNEHQRSVQLLMDTVNSEFGMPLAYPGYTPRHPDHYWVALDGDVVVGSVALNVENGFGVLKRMFVHKDYRGKEKLIAQQLLDTALNRCHDVGVDTLYLGTMYQFIAAQKFYIRAGFEKISVDQLLDTFQANPVDTLFFRLEISQRND